MSSTWFISGASKGIGLGLVKSLLSRPSTTVVGTTRDGKLNEALASIVPASGSELIVLPLEVASPTGATEAVRILRETYGIGHIDVVWANSGVIGEHTSLVDYPISELEEVFIVNTFGPIRLLQATLPLLRASKLPKFVVTSTALGSVELASKFAFGPPAYGASKAGVNYLLRRLNQELKELVVVTLHPGLVATGPGQKIADDTGREAITIEESVNGVLKLVDEATKTNDDKLQVYDGGVLPW